ncbi:MAG: hypothetical protein AAGE65_09555 [Planctomycetota bacterium]
MQPSRIVMSSLLLLAAAVVAVMCFGGCDRIPEFGQTKQVVDSITETASEGFQPTADDLAASDESKGDELIAAGKTAGQVGALLPSPFNWIVGALGYAATAVGGVMLRNKSKQLKVTTKAVRQIVHGLDDALTERSELKPAVKPHLAARQDTETRVIVTQVKAEAKPE